MAAFEIIMDGVSLDVSPSSRLTTEFVATTFNEEAVFAGSFVYPVTFPFTPKNIDSFNHSHHLENRAARVRRNVTIVLYGMSWKDATLDYDVTRSGYEGSLTVDNGTVAEKLRELTIPEVFLTKESGKINFHSISLGADKDAAVASMLTENLPGDNLGFCWPTIKNTGILGQESETKFQAINDFDNLAKVDDELFYTPFFYHTWLIREVCAFLGYEARGSYLEDEFIRTIVVYNTGIRTGADFKADRKVTPAYHLPAVSISEYIKGIRNDHRVMIYFDSLTKVAHFELSPVVLNSRQTIDITPSQHHGSIEIRQQAESSIKLITKIDDSDELYKNNKYELSVTVGYDLTRTKEVQLTFGRPFTGNTTEFKNMLDIVMPAAQQTCNIYSDAYKQNDTVYNGGNIYGKNNFSFRMLSYRGFQQIRQSPLYRIPFANSGSVGNGAIRYAQSLEQGGAAGLINQLTLPYYQFYCLSEKVTLSADMDTLQFMALSPLQKMVIADRNQAKVEVLLDKLVFEPREQGGRKSIIGKLTCYPNYAVLGGSQNIRVLVGEAELSTPEGKIYAKLFSKEIRMERDSNGFMERLINDLVIHFYSDESGAFSYSVSNLPYNIEIKKVRYNSSGSSEYISSTTVSGVANGAVHNAGEYEQRYFGGRDNIQQLASLSPPAEEFILVGNYLWFRDRWNLIV